MWIEARERSQGQVLQVSHWSSIGTSVGKRSATWPMFAIDVAEVLRDSPGRRSLLRKFSVVANILVGHSAPLKDAMNEHEEDSIRPL